MRGSGRSQVFEQAQLPLAQPPDRQLEVRLGEQVGETLLHRGATKILQDVYWATTDAPEQP